MKIGPLEFKTKRRDEFTNKDAFKISSIVLLLALIAFSVIFLQAGVNPLEGYWQVISYSFVSKTGIIHTVRRGAFMLFVTLAFIVPLKAGIWNIGAPGQMLAGAVAAIGISFVGSDLSPIVLLPLMFGGAVVAGGGLAAIAGYLKGSLDVNSIVVTVMLNLIMMRLVGYLIEGPWREPGGRAESAQVPLAGRIPMIGDTSLPYTIILAIVLSIVLYYFFTKTSWGYEIECFGSNPRTAKVVGMNFLKVSLLTMAIGGAIAGLGGFHYVAGEPGVYRISFAYWQNVGMWSFYGIIFGLLCLKNSLTAIIPAFLFAGFQVGAGRFQYVLGMQFGAGLAFFGTLVLVMVIGQFFYDREILWSFGKKIEGRGK